MQLFRGGSVQFSAQRGVALLVVLLMMALMTTIAVSMSNRMFINFNRAETQIRSQQAYWYSQAVESLAKYGIKESFSDQDTVTLSQPWAVRDKIYPIDGGQATGNMYDKQACFNLNALRDVKPEQNAMGTNPFLVSALQRLIESQGFEAYQAEMVASSTWEYIDRDDNVQSSQGVEDGEYNGRKIPHYAANGFLADVSEWRAINGVTQEMFEKVSPFLCAIPTGELKVNINTLEESEAPILTALLQPHLTEELAIQLISDRNAIEGWPDVGSFLADPVFSTLTQDDKTKLQTFLDVRSRYFELDTELTLDATTLRLRALLHRDKEGSVTVIRRRFGGVSERIPDDKAEQ